MKPKPTLNQADIDLLNALLDKRFGEVDKRFGEIDKRFGEVDKRFDSLPEQIENIARLVVREETPEILEEKIKHIPTRDEYLTGQSEIMKELKDMREEQAAHLALHDRLEKRVERVEKKVGLPSVIS